MDGTAEIVTRLLLQITATGAEQVTNLTKNITALDLETSKLDATSLRLQSVGTESAASMGTSAAALAKFGLGIGAVSAAVVGFATHDAAQLQTTFTEIQNNTTLSTQGADQMRQTVLKLGQEAPASLSDLAAAYMRVTNMGFQGADATKVLDIAMKSAVSTGSSVADVTNTLASGMHAFGAGANEASHYMDVLHLAAALGNMTLEQMSESFGTAASYAAALGVPVEDVAAAMATMTRNGMDAATAATQTKDALVHIMNPSKQARDEIALLAQTTGHDLTSDFSQAALASKGLFGVMNDIKDVTGGNTEAMARLIPNMRGLLAEIVLTGKGAHDYTSILHQLQEAHGVTDAAFARSQANLNFWLGVLKNDLVEAGNAVGQIFVPAITNLEHELGPATHAIGDFAQGHKNLMTIAAQAGISIGGLALAVKIALALGGAITPIYTAAAAAITAFGGASAAAAGEVGALDIAEAGAVAPLSLVESGLAGVGNVAERASGLLVPAAAATEDTGIAAAGASEALGATGLMGAIGLLLQPEIGIPALAAIAGVVAYEKIPAVHTASDNLADALSNKLSAALRYNADQWRDDQKVMGDFGSALDATGHKVDQFINDHLDNLEHKLDLLPQTLGDKLGQLGNLWDKLPGNTDVLGGIGQKLGQAGAAMDQYGQSEQRATEAEKEHQKSLEQVALETERYYTSFPTVTGGLNRQKQSVDLLTGAYKNYESELSKLQGKEQDALALIAEKLDKGQKVSQTDLDLARQREAAYNKLNDAYTKAGQLVDGDTEALSRFTSAMKTLENQGLVAHTASMTAFADVGISQAQRMHAGVVSEVQAMMHEVATAEAFNPIAAPSILGGPAPIVTTATEHSHSTDGSTPATSEITPEAQQALADLNKTIQGLPPELQSLLSGVSTKFSSDLQTSYNSFLDKYNAENTRDAAAKQAIVNDEHQKIADAYASAESKDKADHDEYLSKLKALQDTHNQDLSSRLTTFVQQFQQVLANFQASLAIEQTKAGDITQTHNDKLQQLYDDYTSKLQGIHGKNADERKQALEAQYSRAVQLEDTHYQNSIRAEEQHITGMTGAFDRHVKGMDTSFNQGMSKSEASYKANQEALANGYLAHVTGIKTALDASVKKSEESAGTSLSKEETIHKNHVDSLNAAFEKHVASLSASLEKGLSPDKLLATLKTGASDAYNAALAQGTLDELNTGSLSSSDAAALQTAIDNQNELSDAEKKALATVTALDASLQTFATTVKGITDRITADEDTLAKLIYTGHTSDISQSTAPNRRIRSAENMGTSDLPTVEQATVTDLVQAEKDSQKATEAKTKADILAAQATGNWTTVLSDSQTKVKSDADRAMAGLTHLLGSDVSHSIQSLSQLGQVAPAVAAQLQRSATEEEQQTIRDTQASRLHELAMIRAAQAAGDLAGAFDKQKSLDSSDLGQSFSALEEHFRTGAGDLATLEAAYQRNQAAVDLDTAAQTQAYEATGQYADALKALTDGPTKDFENALAKVNIDLLTHSGNLGADVAAAQQARGAKDAETQATWDATFATSSLADQSKMLSQRFSALVSHQNTIDSAQSSVDSANIAIIAAQSALAVDGINAEAKATEDLAGIIGKEDALRSASASGQIAAITDQTKYISDSTAVLKATSPEALRVAQQQLLIDQVTAQEHRAEAAWQVRLASDALRTEQDKARGDQAASAAQIRVAGDALQVAVDSRQISLDSQQIAIDTLDVLQGVASSLGDVNDYGEQLKQDVATLSADKGQLSGDQTSLGNDTASANAIAAYNAQQAAMDSLLTAYDQSGSSSTSQDYQLQLAYLEQQKALYQVAVDQLSTQQQMASNLGAYSGQLQQMLFDFMGLLNLPAVRKNVVGMGTAQQMNGGGYAVQTITTVTPS